MAPFSLSGAFCLHNKVCVLEQNDDSVLIGMVHAEDAELMDKISAAFVSSSDGKGIVHFMPVSEEECLRCITGSIADGAEVQEETAGYERADLTDDMAAPAVSLLDNIVLEAIARNASDIHLEPYTQPSSDETGLCVRFRTAGTLQFYRMYDKNVFEQLIRRIKVLAGLNEAESRLCQDGRFIWQSAGKIPDGLRVDIRVSCIPVWNGESVVLRLLRTLEDPPTLMELGFSMPQQEVISRILKMSSRLVIVAGSTGAGKTTTLAAMLSVLAGEGRKIVSVEDPVEYRIPGVTQVEIDEDGGLGFQEVLKRVFRHDPDVLMIGEIRDEVTAQIACRAALTGHLVFATMHSENAGTAAMRLFDFKIPQYILPSVFGAIIAQKLIPCPEKKEGRFKGRLLAAEILEGVPRVLQEFEDFCCESGFNIVMEAEGMQRIDEDAEMKQLLLTNPDGLKKKRKATSRKEVYRDL